MAGTTSTARTARVLVAIMDDVYDFLGFTIEIGEDFSDQKLPTLDVKIWIRNGMIEYEFMRSQWGQTLSSMPRQY